MCNAWCTSLAYDQESQVVFVGDYSGAITVLKLEQTGVKFINTLKVRCLFKIISNNINVKGHSGSIQCLAWDGSRNWLYSGSYDSSVFV